MSQRVVCTGCGRIYDLDDSLSGGKGAGTRCGTVARVPGQNPVGKSSTAALSPDDLYALNEGPAAAPASFKRETASDDDLGPLPRPVRKTHKKNRSTSSFRLDDLFSDAFFKY